MHIWAILQKRTNDIITLITFLFKRLSPERICSRTFERELLKIYLAINNLSSTLQGREFMIITGHKPLCYTFNASFDRYSPREARQMGYISQFTTDIQFTKGYSNILVSALS